MGKAVRKMNLQLFADGAEGTPSDPPQGAQTEGGTNETSYTQADLDAKLAEAAEQSKQELATAQKNWEKEYAKKLEKEKAEAEKLATLSAEERAKAEFEKEKQALSVQKAAFEKEQLQHEVGKTLLAEKLDPSFAAFLTGADADSSNENIKNFKSAFEAAVEAAVIERIKGTPPTAGVEKPKAVYTKDEIAKMSTAEINKNWDSIKTLI